MISRPKCCELVKFRPLVDIFQRDLKRIEKGNICDHQSVQSGAGKLSCNKMALKRCTSTEHLGEMAHHHQIGVNVAEYRRRVMSTNKI